MTRQELTQRLKEIDESISQLQKKQEALKKELGITFEEEFPKKDEQQPAEIENARKMPVTEKTLEIEVSKYLKMFGVPAHIKGYIYLRTAILLCIKDREAVESITKVLYPSVAKQYGTTSSRVERAIRHAIETSFERCDVEVFQKVFSHGFNIKPTNSEFVAGLADKICLDLM